MLLSLEGRWSRDLRPLLWRFSRRDCLLEAILGRSRIDAVGEADSVRGAQGYLVRDLRIFLSTSPSTRLRGKPLIGKSDRLKEPDLSSVRWRSIDTIEISEVTRIAILSRSNSPLSIMVCMVWASIGMV